MGDPLRDLDHLVEDVVLASVDPCVFISSLSSLGKLSSGVEDAEGGGFLRYGDSGGL